MLPDTHAHLDGSDFVHDLDHVIARAEEAGVIRILAVGTDAASSEKAVALAQRYHGVFAAVGVHPHEVARFSGEAAAVRSLLREKKVVAVGEVGLDYYRHMATREQQLESFRTQLGWAVESDLPVSVHNREADEDVLAELRASGARAVLHCFSSTENIAKRAMTDGHMLSFAGNVTFPKAEALRHLASWISLEHLLVETDSPVLAPQPWRGRRNEPAYVTATAEMLAASRGVALSELSAAVCANADTTFRWGEA